MAKPRPHDYCHECGSDLGEMPPTPPRCRKCHRPVKGHKGPWGIGRCKEKQSIIDADSFFKATIKAWDEALDRELMANHPGVIATMTGGKR